jgi:hypothetical protein
MDLDQPKNSRVERSKSALRTLQRLPDIPPLHQTESKKILSAFSQALVSTSLREKNELLSEVESLWTAQNDKFEQAEMANLIKRDELNNLKIRGQQMIQECDLVRQNRSFSIALSKRKKVRTNEELIQLIQQQEIEIEQLQPPNSRQMLTLILTLNSDPMTKQFRLLDLNLRRIEELAWCYRKRLQAMEASQDSNELVMKEYGSVQEMIDRVQTFCEEPHTSRSSQNHCDPPRRVGNESEWVFLSMVGGSLH